jgi:U1 small nuclear ribonucleoprotein of 70kDa MW N terminal
VGGGGTHLFPFYFRMTVRSEHLLVVTNPSSLSPCDDCSRSLSFTHHSPLTTPCVRSYFFKCRKHASRKMTSSLPPNLRALFKPRPPQPFIKPRPQRSQPPYSGIAAYASHFEDPSQTGLWFCFSLSLSLSSFCTCMSVFCTHYSDVHTPLSLVDSTRSHRRR